MGWIQKIQPAGLVGIVVLNESSYISAVPTKPGEGGIIMSIIIDIWLAFIFFIVNLL